MKFRAAVIRQMGLPQPYAQSKPLHIEEVELTPPGEREVLVRVRAAGLRHSDLSTINANRPRQMPMVLGHEAAGEVIECGLGVNDRQGRLPVNKLLSSHIKLEQINEGFDNLASGHTVRQIITI